MRRPAVLLLFLLSTTTLLASRPAEQPPQQVTIAQLEQTLAAAHGVHDGKLAQRLYDLRLTERLSTAERARLDATLPGSKSRDALQALADESAPLDLPAAEVPPLPPPDAAAQKAMLARMAAYLSETIPKLPSFSATRSTIHYEGTALPEPQQLRDLILPDRAHQPDQRLAPIATTKVATLMSNGHELHMAGRKTVSFDGSTTGFSSTGEFGPTLIWVQRCIHSGSIGFSHWEQNDPEQPNTARRAVFNFQCSGQAWGDWTGADPFTGTLQSVGVLVGGLLQSGPAHGGFVFEATPPSPVIVNGNLTLDPADGSILRLAYIERGVFPSAATRAGAYEVFTNVVQYGAIPINAASYLCPVKSITMNLQPELVPASLQARLGITSDPAQPPEKEFMNVVTFSQYHLFHAESHIVDDPPSTTPQP
ncbi:MAG: hypothetical protein HIU91_10505 [Acidobacteria bacterium]|nr:hypothetical protein [Acidobacteriota bacterium]